MKNVDHLMTSKTYPKTLCGLNYFVSKINTYWGVIVLDSRTCKNCKKSLLKSEKFSGEVI